ncbi:LytR/AlgR family response regulator transcription factor [Shewanella dokdonensis]|uniref:Response regulator transcription factor n=1 Tax=Shewanella dokdonensis TaxID=712036 RepID=A0ABX8DJU0_9GAMM|nr:LytTR family DNA-binding domain-containing protein [Shewanella dokdonensis]MCL1075948.1 LytTR family DNA-binding domain-containing protein [Shewanella dokdonensis]QVK24261.1 response regulator transcription factor [Shewanella dokdonensis]
MKAIIVEDEPLAMEELLYIIQKHSRLDVVATFEDGLDAFKYLQQQQVDVAFLDINVPSIDGMLLARNIHQFAKKPFIVFTTAHKDFAAEAFEIEAFDYILKPFNESRIQGVLQKLEASTEAATAPPVSPPANRSNTVNLYKGERICVTDVSAILYVEAAEKQTKVFTTDDEFMVPMTISEFIEKLPPTQFFRCHRSYCLNLTKVQEITPWYNSTYLVKLQGSEQQLPVSRSRLREFRELMQL